VTRWRAIDIGAGPVLHLPITLAKIALRLELIGRKAVLGADKTNPVRRDVSAKREVNS
jgi:hypothetical protein